MHYERQLVDDFLVTLKGIRYPGEIHIIDYGLSTACSQRIANYENVFTHPHLINIRVECQRYRDLVTHIKGCDADVIMTIDGGDVWFQDNFDELFSMCREKIGVINEIERWSESWSKDILDKLKDPYYTELLGDRPISGSGMICGPKDKMLEVLNKTRDVIENIGKDFFGVDQVAFNSTLALASKLDADEIISLPQTYGFMIIPKYNVFFLGNNGMLYDENKELIKVVHNGGGETRTFPEGRISIGQT